MCDVCLKTPCHPNCPYAPEPPAVHTCDRCSEGIPAGAKFIREPDGDILCGDCLDNMDVNDLLSELGISMEEAEAC